MFESTRFLFLILDTLLFQIASDVGLSPGHTVHLLQPLTAKTVCVAGKKLISFRRKDSQYMLCSGNQLQATRIVPAVVPAQKSPSSVATKFTTLKNSINKDITPLLAHANLIRDCPPLVPLVKSSVVKPVQASEFSTKHANPTLKLRQLLSAVGSSYVSDKLRTPSSNMVSDNSVHTSTTTPRLTLTTHATQTDSTASCTLTPDVVNTTQNKPKMSVLKSNPYAAAIIPNRLESSLSSPAFIPLATELSSANFEKSPAVSLRNVASNITVRKKMRINTKSVESESVNMNVTSALAATRPTMPGVSLEVPHSSSSVLSGNGVDSEESKMSQNDSVSSVRILDEKSGKYISSHKDLDEKSQDGVTTSDEKKPQADISSIVSSNEKPQSDTSRVRRTSKEKLQNNKISSAQPSSKRTHKSPVPSPKRNCRTASSRESRSKARGVSASTTKSRLRSNSKRKRTDVPVEMMVTRSSSRRK
jgi:hypothetical protein